MTVAFQGRRRRAVTVPKLQITSMMDMFTIILIFLLFSFSERPPVTGLDKDMQLPESIARMDYTDTIKLVLSRTRLTLDGELIAELKDDRLLDFKRGKDTKRALLFERLSALKTQTDPEAAEDAPKPQVLFFCDKALPFRTINAVVKTAGRAGFVNLQFAVLEQ